MKNVHFTKVKFCPLACREGAEGEWRHSSTLSLTLALDRGGWSTLNPGLITLRSDPVPTVPRDGWAPGSVWTCAENIASTGMRSPDRATRSESLCGLSYPGPRHTLKST